MRSEASACGGARELSRVPEEPQGWLVLSFACLKQGCEPEAEALVPVPRRHVPAGCPRGSLSEPRFPICKGVVIALPASWVGGGPGTIGERLLTATGQRRTSSQIHVKWGEEAGLVGTLVSWETGTPSTGGSVGGWAHSILDIQSF